MFNKIISFLSNKLFKINDSPGKIAFGAGLGVFSGIFPGTGPLAALFLAFIFKANRAAALICSMLTNTWLALVTFVLAIKAGSAILGTDWRKVQESAWLIINDFNWIRFWKLSFFEVFLPVIIGYLIISLALGVFSYLIILVIIRRNFHGDKTTHQ